MSAGADQGAHDRHEAGPQRNRLELAHDAGNGPAVARGVGVRSSDLGRQPQHVADAALGVDERGRPSVSILRRR